MAMTRDELQLAVLRGQVSAAMTILESAFSYWLDNDLTDRQRTIVNLLKEEYNDLRGQCRIDDDSPPL